MKRPGRRSAAPFGEKDFYLEEFAGRAVLFAIDGEVARSRTSLDDLASTVWDLVRNGTRVLVWWPGQGGVARLTNALRHAGPRAGRSAALAAAPVALPDSLDKPAAIAELRTAAWLHLRRTRLCLVRAADASSATTDALAVAAALTVPKVVVVDRLGGLRPRGGALAFVDESVLETVLRTGEAEWAGLGARRHLMRAVRDALAAGVESVNLCQPRGVARELFTYVGSGTLFTQGNYCRIESLALDAYAQAERLIAYGEREGLLKRRRPAEVAALLATGFGAMVGGRHLAGVVSLVTAPYAGSGMGELAGLYTITRFSGEGVGRRLVDRVVETARERGLEAVFACTIDRRAQRFFREQGFEPVAPAVLPAVKWAAYDTRRRRRVRCLLRRC